MQNLLVDDIVSTDELRYDIMQNLRKWTGYYLWRIMLAKIEESQVGENMSAYR